jgi:hypothetical protein
VLITRFRGAELQDHEGITLNPETGQNVPEDFVRKIRN